MTRDEVWVHFAAAIVNGGMANVESDEPDPAAVASYADEFLAQYDARFPQQPT